jgi:catechol 2,3-dioxygenase-like lactoylglutathione lyase family enzyme
MYLVFNLFMISGVGSVAILANDPKKLAEWYHDKLDFEIVGNEGHSVFVKPKGSGNLLLHLCGKSDSWENDKSGGRTGVWFYCGQVFMNRHKKTGQLLPASDPREVEKTYLELKRRGVEFTEELTTTDWGKYAIMKDAEGNEFEIS